MDPANLLTQLKDIHGPGEIAWWPMAIGWWFLIIIIPTLTIAITLLLIKNFKRNSWRRAALKELKSLEDSYLAKPNATELSALSALLKRCLTSKTGDISFLALSQTSWASCLAAKQKDNNILLDSDIQLLSEGLYRKDCEALDTAGLKRIKKWIKNL
jgi:hypothetical protein